MLDPEARERHAQNVRENNKRAEMLGRWPANIIHDGSEEVTSGFPERNSPGPGASGSWGFTESRGWNKNNIPKFNPDVKKTSNKESGSTSRYFYQVKPEDQPQVLNTMNNPSFKVLEGDSLHVLKTLPENSVEAIVTDPPYGLSQHKQSDIEKCLQAWLSGKPYEHKSKGFMGKSWDSFVPGPELWREVYRVLKPGGHVLAFAGTRTQDLMGIALRLAGFEYRDCIMWIYGCLSEDTEVFVNTYWTPHSTLKVGDLTTCFDPSTGDLSQQPIEEIVRYQYDDRAYTITSGDTSQLVSKNHRCLIWNGEAWVYEFAENLPPEIVVPVYKYDSQGRAGVHQSQANVLETHYKGIMWCIKVPTGAFMARRHDQVFITGNSGFPKSLNISKAIDKEAGAEREVKETRPNDKAGKGRVLNFSTDKISESYSVTVPATEEAKKWDGWGSSLKPAYEPVLMFRKPIEGTVASNVIEHGTGGLNIDGCRVPTGESTVRANSTSLGSSGHGIYGEGQGGTWGAEAGEGRWPANIIHDGSEEVTCNFPNTTSGKVSELIGAYPGESNTRFLRGSTGPHNTHGDSGSAARFFYCSKAGKRDRDEGLERFQTKAGHEMCDREEGSAGSQNPRAGTRHEGKNHHATVKPTDLMRYLCRLITPPGGTVLDPFNGSGSTGKAAVLEGFNYIGVEIDEEYARISRARIAHALNMDPNEEREGDSSPDEDEDGEDSTDLFFP